MSLETDILQRGIECIRHIQYVPDERQLTIHLTACRSNHLQNACLVFSGIQDYSDAWHFPEDEIGTDDDGDCLIGLDAYPQLAGVRYVVETLRREIIVVTSISPLLQDTP